MADIDHDGAREVEAGLLADFALMAPDDARHLIDAAREAGGLDRLLRQLALQERATEIHRVEDPEPGPDVDTLIQIARDSAQEDDA